MWPGLESPTELNAAAEGGRSGYTDIGRLAVLVRAGASGTWRITSYGRNRSGNGRGSHTRRVSRRRRRAFKRASGCWPRCRGSFGPGASVGRDARIEGESRERARGQAHQARGNDSPAIRLETVPVKPAPRSQRSAVFYPISSSMMPARHLLQA